jgi:hypothetical protein
MAEIRVNVSSVGSKGTAQATNNAVQYWAEKAREWAISENPVSMEDNSSKYYAGKAKEYAQSAQQYKNDTQEIADTAESNIDDLTSDFNSLYTEKSKALQSEYSNYSSSLEAAKTSAITSIQTTGTEANTSITTASTSALSDITTAKNTAVEDIQDEADTQISNIQSTGFYMRDGRLYYVDSEGQEQEFKSGEGLPLLSIRPALYVDESLGLDYYLNGQLLTVNSNLQGAVNELKKLKAIRSSLFCTEEEWQAEKEASNHGQVGKFVLNETAGTLRLPAVINIQGVFDLQNAGLTVQAGLPNIVGDLMTNGNSFTAISGAFATRSQISNLSGGHSAATGYGNLTFDASHSNPIYGNNTTVQEEAIQYPYVICLATGQETEVNIRNDIESLNPYTLFDAKYSEAKQYNASWVLGGSTLSKSVYPTAYEAALVEYNSEVADGTTVELPSGGSYTKRGVSGGVTVKLSTDETVTEYDWKLDTVAEILTAPTLNGSEDLLSDRYDDLELKASSSTYVAPANGWYVLSKRTNAANQTVVLENHTNGVQSGVIVPSVDHIPRIYIPAKKNDVIEARYTAGGDLDTFRFIYAKGNGSLYFLVASVAQNVPLANLGRIEETKVDKNSSWGFPSNRYIDLELGASGSTYTAPANGWYYLQKKTGANNQHSFIQALKDGETATEYGALEWTTMGNNGNANILKVPKGKKVQIHYNLTGATEIFRFIYAEGSY